MLSQVFFFFPSGPKPSEKKIIQIVQQSQKVGAREGKRTHSKTRQGMYRCMVYLTDSQWLVITVPQEVQLSERLWEMTKMMHHHFICLKLHLLMYKSSLE